MLSTPDRIIMHWPRATITATFLYEEVSICYYIQNTPKNVWCIYSVFTETVREQVKAEVGQTASRIYNHMEWVEKGHTNNVAGLNMLHGVH